MKTKITEKQTNEKQTNCSKGNHTLEVIYRVNVGYNEENVVRWCKYCGSVVVDIDSDNRTFAGRIMKMKKPLY